MGSFEYWPTYDWNYFENYRDNDDDWNDCEEEGDKSDQGAKTTKKP